MSGTTLSKKPFRFTGLHMALCIVAFFGVIITVNIYMATLASSSWTGLVVKNSYVASQKFNGELKAAHVQHAQGWVSQLHYKDGTLQFKLVDREGKLIELTNAAVYLGRPAFEQQDQSHTFISSGNGLQISSLKLAAGPWELRITGSVGEKPYRRDARILVDGTHSGKIQ